MKYYRSGRLALSQKQSLLWWLAGGSLILAGILLTTSSSNYINDLELKVNENEIYYVGTDFENQDGGEFINEGTVVFTGSILNMGALDCASCVTGANYVRNDWGQFQTISSEEFIKMHDVILDNQDGLDLEAEWQIANSLDFEKGIIRSDRDFGNIYFLHMQEGSVIANFDDDRHVDGYVAKSGEGDFLLPTGDGDQIFSVGVYGNAKNSFFRAAYYPTDPNNGAFYPGGPFFTDKFDIRETTYVNETGFWHVEGNTSTTIELFWNDRQNLMGWTQSPDSIVVLGWKDDYWQNLGQISVQGNIQKGSVVSRQVVPDDYEAFTIGKRNPGWNPVEYLTFDAVQVGDDGYLYWTTTREINSFYFDVERSVDAIIFEKFGQVQAGGNTDTIQNYDFTDIGIALKDLDRVFYRIRQVDLDGSFIYSQVEELVFGKQEEEVDLVIYPNPAIDDLKIRYKGLASLDARLKIYNVLGQLVEDYPLARAVDTTFNVAHLAVGHYVVTAGNENVQASKKLVIAR